MHGTKVFVFVRADQSRFAFELHEHINEVSSLESKESRRPYRGQGEDRLVPPNLGLSGAMTDHDDFHHFIYGPADV